MFGVQKLKMNQHSLHEGDPPGQIIRLAPYEPRDSQGRTLDVARYQDRSLREEDAVRWLEQLYRPLRLISRVCAVTATVVFYALPFSSLVLCLLFMQQEVNPWPAFGCFLGALLYLFLYPAWIAEALDNRLKRLRAEAQANGVDLDTTVPHGRWTDS